MSPRTSACTAVDLFEPVDGGDVRMIERGENLRFAREARQEITVEGEQLEPDKVDWLAIHCPSAKRLLARAFVVAPATARSQRGDRRPQRGGCRHIRDHPVRIEVVLSRDTLM